ncbi:MAG: hypothetical protein CFE44_18090 [Burkholderiales bacterium PBB4]|nr:MAG: hypothetical protein CFE44_18090 [Burkholderiales bacterium PBB4]
MRAFVRYVAVAAVVACITVAMREGLAWALPANLYGKYGWTMAVAYAAGVVLNYIGQGRFTFAASAHRASRHAMARFAALACISALLTALLAYVIRYGLPLEDRLPTWAAAIAFAAASLLMAPLSFSLARMIVFALPTKAAPQTREPRWVWILLMLLTIGHVAMVSQVVLRYDSRAVYDSALFMQLAQSLAEGQWLGPYSALTLIKGPGFAFWLAAVHALHVPVSAAAALTYALSCILIFSALRPCMPALWPRLALFLALLLCPFAFGNFEVMRELIYPAITLALVACGMGLALRLEQLTARVQPWIWAVALGLASAQILLTREESIWLVPVWLGVVIRSIWLVMHGRVRAAPVAMASVVCALAGVLPVTVVVVMNHHHYGVWTGVEINSRPFISAYGALVRVHATTLPQIPVPSEIWGPVASVSPAFAELNTHLQGDIGRFWVGNNPSVDTIGAWIDDEPMYRHLFGELLHIPLLPGSTGGAEIMRDHYYGNPLARRRLESFLGGPAGAQRFFETKNEIGAGSFLWALRDSASTTGHHINAQEAERFYRALADEVNGACTKGMLSCDPERHSLHPQLPWSRWRAFLDALISVSGLTPQLVVLTTGGPTANLGTRNLLHSAEAFLWDSLAPTRSNLPVSQPLEALISVYRQGLPWVSAIAILGWLIATPLPGRKRREPQSFLWWIALPLLAMVGLRLSLVALIHVTSWPVYDIRYMSAAYPLLVLFDGFGCGLLVLSLQTRPGRPKP